MAQPNKKDETKWVRQRPFLSYKRKIGDTVQEVFWRQDKLRWQAFHRDKKDDTFSELFTLKLHAMKWCDRKWRKGYNMSEKERLRQEQASLFLEELTQRIKEIQKSEPIMKSFLLEELFSDFIEAVALSLSDTNQNEFKIAAQMILEITK